MLCVNAKFVASELVPGLVNGEYNIERGATIRDLLAVCESQCNVSIPLKNFQFMYPLFNGRPASLDEALTENGIMHLCRVIMGG